MLCNEIYEVGQHICLFESSITNRNFKRLVVLTKPIGSTFIHRYIGTGDNYNLQEWRYTNPDGSTGHTYLSLGKVQEQARAEQHTSTFSYNVMNNGNTYTFSLV